MKTLWHSDGEANEEGDFVAEIQDDNGRMRSMFKGKTHKEVADKLLASYASSTAEFDRLRSERKPDRAPASTQIAPRPLSADDSFRLGAELTSPNTAPQAIEEIITKAVGAAPAVIGQTLADLRQERELAYVRAEAAAFLEANPDYYPDDRNKGRLLKELQLKGLDVTRNNLQIVYEELESQGLMLQKPEGFEQQQEHQPESQPAGKSAGEPKLPETRPRLAAMSTGMRSGDARAPRPATTPKPKVTRAELEAMPREEYLTKLRDPVFRAAVDALPA